MATIPVFCDGTVRWQDFSAPKRAGLRSARRSAEAERLSPVAALVRRHDRDRYQTALFAPAARREALFALYAFNYEIARVRESVTQPMLGQIRLEWWREDIAAAYAGAPARGTKSCGRWSRRSANSACRAGPFDRIIDARERDLDDAPPADLAALVDYAEGTSAALIYLALEALGAPSLRRWRRRARSASPMRSPACCGRCRFMPPPGVVTSAGCREAGRARSGRL